MNALAGTAGLARLILRRDRILLPLWVLLLGILPVVYASATDELYPTAEGLRTYYQSIVGNASLMSMLGPAFGASLGALTVWRAGIQIVLIGLVSLLTVIRHTRTEEDAGRRELLGATVVGRLAPLAAALLVTGVADLALGAFIAVTLVGYGLPVTGSVACGVSFALGGWVFAAVGGVAAQLTEGAGAARGIAIAVLGAAYGLRAVGDSGGLDGGTAWLSWLSPIGWVQRVRPYAGEQWWVLGLLLAFAAGLAAVAVSLLARRDLNAGVLPTPTGPAGAAPSLRSPLALAWRLHRALLAGWSAGFLALGVAIGGASRSVDSLVEDSPQLKDMLARLGGTASLRDSYLAASLGLLALVVSGYGIQATLRLRAEEAGLRAEPVLAAAVGRIRWMASHLAFGLAGPAVVLAVLAAGTALGSGSSFGGVLEGALFYLPAAWLLAGIAVALFGLLPRLAAAVAWTALGVCAFLMLLGPLLQLDQRILDISPFVHTPQLPGGTVTAAPIVVLLAVAAAMLAAGLAGFRRRDIVSSA